MTTHGDFFLQAVEYLPELSRQIRRLCSSDFRLPLLLPLLPAMLSGILHAALRQGSQGDVAGVKCAWTQPRYRDSPDRDKRQADDTTSTPTYVLIARPWPERRRRHLSAPHGWSQQKQCQHLLQPRAVRRFVIPTRPMASVQHTARHSKRSRAQVLYTIQHSTAQARRQFSKPKVRGPPFPPLRPSGSPRARAWRPKGSSSPTPAQTPGQLS